VFGDSKFEGMGKRKHHKLPHIVSNDIAEYKPVASGVKVAFRYSKR